jgi:uncharacterized membrane protein YfcA
VTPTLSLEAVVLAVIVVFVGYVVFGVTGFGASPITVPLLAHFLPLAFVLPLAGILDLASAIALGLHTRREAQREELFVLIPFTLLGLVLGVTLLVNLPRALALRALGGFVCAYALYAVSRRDVRYRLGRIWAVPAGLSGGVLGALFGVGGPPYVMYVTGRVTDPARQRATIAQMVILSVGLRMAVFAVAGLLFTRGLWSSVALLLPVAWAGVWVGHRLQAGMPPTVLARIIAVALCLTGVSLIVRTLN